MKYQLREYQQKAVDAGVKFMQEEKGGAIIVAPVGAGKSLIVAAIAKELDGDTLVLQPSKELVLQNIEKAKAMGVDDITIFSASLNTKEIGSCTFATVGSIVNCLDKFSNFKNLIIDECDRVNSRTGMYKKVIDHFNGHCVGLSATPFRMHAFNNIKTGHNCVVAKFLHRTRPRMFDKIIHITQIQEMYEKGFLCPIKYIVARGYNHSDIKLNSSGMDFDQQALRIYNAEKGIIKIIVGVIQKEDAKHILVFTASVEESESLTKYLDSLGITSATVSANTPANERANIVEKFKSGEIRVVSSMGIFLIGFDFPALDCIIIARPTQSISLIYQAMGRGVRKHPSKEFVKIYDLAGNVPRFGKIETFRFTEDKPGMHRMVSDIKPLTGYDYVNNIDLEKANYSDYKESSFGQSSDILQFGLHKGKHITRIPNNYLKWCAENLQGSWNEKFKLEVKRRNLQNNGN